MIVNLYLNPAEVGQFSNILVNMYTRKGFDFVRAVLKDGLQLLIYSAKEVLRFFGMNSLWEKQTNNIRRALQTDGQ